MAACAQKPPTATVPVVAPVSPTAHVPDFAVKPYEPFSRAETIAIALREWRLFGQPVDDDPPDTRPPPLPEQKPERQPGLWQRVGEYWWIGMNAGVPEAAWTGKHDAFGTEFPASQDGDYAWSAAFVSYVMRVAGAGMRFPYSISHDTYINAAFARAQGQATGYGVTAQATDRYAPVPGDLICESRLRKPLRYADLPVASFPSHCDFVVETVPGRISVVGGNVDDAVTLKHVPTLPDGRLASADGAPLDTRYPWFVVLQVSYDTDAASVAFNATGP